jgi:signal transduction histidine kinase
MLISDFAENVWKHADADGGVATIQFHREEQTLELAIADCGIGIRGSLLRNPDYAHLVDDLLAVREATKPGVTGDAGSGGGLGLYLTRLVLAENGGTLIVRSGEGHVEHRPRTKFLSRVPRFWGTLIVVVARTDQPLDYEVVDRLLTTPSGARDF